MADLQDPSRPAAGLRTPPPRHPEYNTLESRLQSFTGWPQAVVGVTPQRLADTGFYYIGSADRVRCYQCGITLRNWEAEDDPLTEHMTWSPECPFLLTEALNMGGDSGFRDLQRHDIEISEDASGVREVANINTAQIAGLGVTVNLAHGNTNNPAVVPLSSTSETTEVAPTPQTSESAPASSSAETPQAEDVSVPREHEQPLMVQAVISMGYSQDVVNRIRAAKRRRDGEDFTDAASLLQAILDEEAQMTWSSSDAGVVPSSGHSSPSQGQSEVSEPPSLQPVPTARPQAYLSSSGSASAQPYSPSSDSVTSAQPTTSSAGASTQPLSSSTVASTQPQSSSAVASAQPQPSSTFASAQSQSSFTVASAQSQPSSTVASAEPQTSSTVASAEPQPSSTVASAEPQTSSTVASAEPQPSSTEASAQPQLRRVRPGRCQLCGDAEVHVTFLPCGHLISCQDCARLCQWCPMCRRQILGTVKIYFA